MDTAIKLALQNIDQRKGGPFAAVLVKNDTIISTGCNLVTTKHDPTAHAEIECIRHACQQLKTFDLSGYELYTTCEPCPMCLGAIYWAHISKVYYAATRHNAAKAGFNDTLIYTEIQKDMADRQIPFQQVNHHQASDIFKAWKNSPHKILY
jgi:tRNA(Arg) A34 adenosine deaminase TadA